MPRASNAHGIFAVAKEQEVVILEPAQQCRRLCRIIGG
jgi:hypothetical protein